MSISINEYFKQRESSLPSREGLHKLQITFISSESRPAKGPHHEKFKGDRAFPFIILLDIGEVRSQILGHRESLDLVLTEDLRHLLVGSEVLLVLRVLC